MESYKDTIFEPLEYYINHGKEAHRENVSAYFEELVKRSGVDLASNKATVTKYYAKISKIEAMRKKLSGYKATRIIVIVASVILFLVATIAAFAFSETYPILQILLPIIALAIGIPVSIIVFKIMSKKIRELEPILQKKTEEAELIKSEAEAQMAPLNDLFTDDDTFMLIEKTLPQLKFDKQFLLRNYQDLKNNYNFNETLGNKSSVLEVISGRLYKNPFLFERFVTEKMDTHTYKGTLTIRWTTLERSNGKTVRRTHHQTLVATVTKPKPFYDVTTLLSYGSQAAPDLIFSRENKHFEDLSEKQIEKKVRSGEKKLKKKAEKALGQGKSFTEMSNTKFDVLFDATNRDNEQQFRVMFTPLAQREMIDLIRSEEGYGDDFDFFKRKKLNVIRSEHAQNWNMSTLASRYYSFDFEIIKNKFSQINCEYFKSVYFDFAPIIAIPAYQEPPTTSFEDIEASGSDYTSYNFETIANKMNSSVFAHKNSKTQAILKTELVNRSKSGDTVAVTAYSYFTAPRTDFVSVLGGDGKIHAVPVHWLEYIPEQKTTLMTVSNVGITHTEYLKKIKNLGLISAPENAICYKGILAYTGMPTEKSEAFINSLIK